MDLSFKYRQIGLWINPQINKSKYQNTSIQYLEFISKSVKIILIFNFYQNSTINIQFQYQYFKYILKRQLLIQNMNLISILSRPQLPDTESQKHYFKLAFNKAHISRNANLCGADSKLPDLYFKINAQIVTPNPDNQDRENKYVPIGQNMYEYKTQQLKIYETSRSDDHEFTALSPKWDCLQIDEQYLIEKSSLNERPKLYLELSFSIHKNSHSIEIQSQQFGQLIAGFTLNKSKLQTRFPIKLDTIVIPLEQFIKEPYQLHVTNLDFKIPKSQKQVVAERDGMISFTFTFLKDFRAELNIQNVRIQTKSFSKNYKLRIFQKVTSRKDLKKNKIKEKEKQLTQKQYYQTLFANRRADQISLKQQSQNGYIQLDFEPHGWNQFRNDQSFITPYIMPLNLLNEEDQIAVLVQYEQPREIIGKFLIGTNILPSRDTVGRIQPPHYTVSSIIKVKDLFKRKTHQWQCFTIEISNETKQLKLEFEFIVKAKKGDNANDLPKSLNRSINNFQFFDSDSEDECVNKTQKLLMSLLS